MQQVIETKKTDLHNLLRIILVHLHRMHTTITVSAFTAAIETGLGKARHPREKCKPRSTNAWAQTRTDWMHKDSWLHEFSQRDFTHALY